MPLSDVFSSRLAGPTGKLLDGPIRGLVHEILREQGYASPAEVQALRDDVRDLASRLTAAEGRLADLTRTAEAASNEGRATAAALRGALAELQALRDAPAATAAPVAVTIVPVVAEPPVGPATALAGVEPKALVATPKSTCTVPGCGGDVRSKGFCSPHYQQWRRGNLERFVGQDGHVRVGDLSFRVAASYAGRLVDVVGDALTIDGKAVSAR